MKWMIATTRQLIAAAYFLGAVTALPAIAEEPNGIVVYESDFGLKDGAVSEMRAVAVSIDPSLRLENLTHEIPAFDIWQGAYRLGQTAPYWPPGTVFVSVADRDKRALAIPVARLQSLGFEILATAGTAAVLHRNGIPARLVRKASDGRGPDGEPTITDLIESGEVDMVVNTPSGQGTRADGYEIRAAAVAGDKALFTTMAVLGAAVSALPVLREGFDVKSLQEYAADRAVGA